MTMNITGYQIIKELYSSADGLTVYEAKNDANGEHCIIRLMDYSKNNAGGNSDLWYEVYEKYQLEVSNFKHLPRVSTIAMLDDSKLYTALTCDSGQTLREKGEINAEQLEQLLDALRHLHSKGLAHGAISPENIWVTEKGTVTLFGAQESKAIYKGAEPQVKDDIGQVVKIVQNFSSINEQAITELENEKPSSLNTLLSILANAKDLPPRKKKAKLVETDKKPAAPPVQAEEKKEEKKQPEPKKQEQPKAEPKKEKKKEEAKPKEEKKPKPDKQEKKSAPEKEEKETRQKKKTGGKFWKLTTGVLVAAVLFLLYTLGSEPESDQAASVEKEPVSEVKEQASEVIAEQKEEKPAEPAETKVAVSYSNEEIEQFMQDYSTFSIRAVNERDFSVVENLVDPTGKSYKEQKDYIDYLDSKGIHEEVDTFKVTEIGQVDETTYKVSTYEKYNIYYEDGSQKLKDFNSGYLVKVLADGRLAVTELLFSDEISSQDVYTEYGEDYSEEEEYTEETVLSDDGGAIESVVRQHYASITNDDFSTAYDLLSSNRKKKMTQKGWEKGLQNNLSDEITYIEVQEIEETKGKVYIEMTSYDDNKDGTTLVQEWSGYWNVIKENGRWVLDSPEIDKIGSRVE